MIHIIVVMSIVQIGLFFAVRSIISDNKQQREKIKTLEESLASSERSLNYAKRHIENITRRNREAITGARVMARSNEDEPLVLGTVLYFHPITQANNPIPIVKIDGDDKEYGVLGAVLPYNEKIFNEVKDLSPKEQWERLKDIALYWE